MYRRVFYGPPNSALQVQDIDRYDAFVLWLLVLAIFAIGIYPNFLLEPMHQSMSHLAALAVKTKLVV